MAKNNCCKICGRSDFDDKVEYLVCRACGEKRKKYSVSRLHFFSIPGLILLGIVSEIIASIISVYKADVYSPNIQPNSFLDYLHSKCYNFSLGYRSEYNELDILMLDLKNHLVWLHPLFIILGIAFFGLALYFIITLYRDLKKVSLSRREKGENYG